MCIEKIELLEIKNIEKRKEIFYTICSKSELLKLFPPFNVVNAIRKDKNSISDWIFINKISYFLQEIDFSQEKIATFDKIFESEEKRIEVGRKLLFLIDSLIDLEKATLIANALKALVHGIINKREFDKILFVIEQCFLGDIHEYKNAPQQVNADAMIIMALENFGFFNPQSGIFEIGCPRDKSEFGLKFCLAVFG